MAAPTVTSLMEDNTIVQIRLEGQRTVGMPKSKLARHSGFFRRMFSHDCLESRQNEVVLHDDEPRALRFLINSISVGRFYVSRTDRGRIVLIQPGNHTLLANVYILLDKYDCEDFKPECREALVQTIASCLEIGYNDGRIVEMHYNKIAGMYGGTYPEDLYPVIAETWRMFSSMDRPCPELDRLIEGDPALTLAVAKSYRARLTRSMRSAEHAKKLMEEFAFLNGHEDHV